MEKRIQIPTEYKELFNPKWRNIVYYGGRGALKSHSVARALLIRASSDNLRILCTRELQTSIKDSVHKLLADLIDKYELNDFLVMRETIINQRTGSQFLFRGIRNNTIEIKSTEGVNIAWCFPGGTLVDGKPIDVYKVGDYVDSWDETTGKIIKKRVTAVLKRPMPEKLYRLTYSGRRDIIATDEHPFYTQDGWKPIKDIKSGDLIYASKAQFTRKNGLLRRLWQRVFNRHAWSQTDIPTQRGNLVSRMQSQKAIKVKEEKRVLREQRVDSVEILEQRHFKQLRPDSGTDFVYNLTVEDTHTYFASGILTHNCEEAHAITDESINILTPTIRAPGSQLIWTFNRMTELDPVYVKYVMNKPDNTYAKQVNYDVAVRNGWFPDVLKQEMEEDKKNNPALYAHKWLGEPLGQADLAIISRDDILVAMQRQNVSTDGEYVVGVDVARMGNDRTVFWARRGLKTIGSKVLTRQRIPNVCDALEQFVEFDKRNVTLKIDDTGVGAGVSDEMTKRGYKVIPINFGGAPQDKTKYPNWISEAWFYLAEQMPNIELEFSQELLMELSTRQWHQDTAGRRVVESKNEYKRRGFRSPDVADAVALCYAPSKTKPIGIIF